MRAFENMIGASESGSFVAEKELPTFSRSSASPTLGERPRDSLLSATMLSTPSGKGR
jgi:hypothetical protein